MRRVAITVFHAYIARNLLYPGLLDALRKESIEPVLLVPESKFDHFKELYGASCEIEPVPIGELLKSRRAAMFAKIALVLMSSHYTWWRRAEARDRSRSVRGYVKYAIEQMFILLLSGSVIGRSLFRKMYARMATFPELRAVLRKAHVHAVFATDIFNEADSLAILEAERLGLRTIGMIRSWDNCYTKGVLSVVPQKLLVNTHILEDEVVSIHGVRGSIVEVVGLPQFDDSFCGVRVSRIEFLKSIGAPHDARLIVLATGGAALTDVDWQYCDIIRRAMDEGKLPETTHVLVRNHPVHAADLSRFGSDRRFTIEYPGKHFGTNRKENELQPLEAKHLADTLFHSDVVVWLATTLGIDASVFSKPQIAIAFDGYESRSYLKSVRRLYDEEHMKKLIDTGGVRVAHSPSELVESISQYMKDPKVDSEGRNRIVETQLVFTDGKSIGRVAEALSRCVPVE